MIKLKINCSRIPKERLFQGKSGKYIDLVLFDKQDTFGNDGFISIDVSKEERERGVKGEIVGNWKTIGTKPKKAPPAQRQAAPQRPADPDLDSTDDSGIPF